ncbi:SDR family NAD(P)-dependent oxidoreductase [Paraburkholderia acidisoli]|uniref:SDR family oxidoreductase n=1 Tax=Paraburkholderia acidisoli TaxID=2571748 RepID=A0A7Z2JDW2_9BURK|nr:SDR family oxidoreductase [Paraburkholderia acidisoli]QGZ61011.1 SDR family oxidoreductase [Paraburkholderia acidisoli]
MQTSTIQAAKHAAKQAAIVTGGNAGIGRAIVEHLLEAGYDVVSLDLRSSAPGHARLHTMEVDLCDADATRAAAAEIAARHGPTTLIHNAGVIRPALLADVAHADLLALTNLHLAAPVTLAQAMLPAMREAHFGRLVLISSRAALGLATRTAYSATKAGMLGLVRTWALELGPLGVTANAIAPGPVQTDMFHAVVPADSPKVAQIAAGIPVGRLGQPDDIARAAMFFAAPENGFVTGQTLYVCGGTSTGSLAL